jgi:hypothetical protein
MEATFHPFMLPRRCVYIIAVDLMSLAVDGHERAQCVNDTRYWLSMILLHTASTPKQPHGAPIILVGTHSRSLSTGALSAISTSIKSFFSTHAAWRQVKMCTGPSPLCIHPVDNADGPDSLEMQNIRLTADCALSEAFDVSLCVPQSWLDATAHLRANLADWTSLEEISRVCATRYNMAPTEVHQLLAFLHEQGLVLWYDQPGKRDIVIVDPLTTLLPRLQGLTADPTDPNGPGSSEDASTADERQRAARTSRNVLAAMLAQKGYHIPRTPDGWLLPLPFLLDPSTDADWQDTHWSTTVGTTIYTMFTEREQLFYNNGLGPSDLKREGFLPPGAYNLVFLEVLKWATLQKTLDDGSLSDVILCRDMAVLYFRDQRFRLSHCAEQNILRLDVVSDNPLSIQRKLLNTIGSALRGVVSRFEYFSAVLYTHAPSARNNRATAAAPTTVPASVKWTGLSEGDVLVPLVKLHRCVQSHQPLRAANRQRLLDESGVRSQFRGHQQQLPTQPQNDVLISNRWNHNHHLFAYELFESFGNHTTQHDENGNTRAVEVFQDWRRIDVGPGFIPNFCMAVPHSLIGLPLVTTEALERMLTHIPDAIDNVLLEWTLMLECFHAKRMRRIFPVLLGERDEALIAGVKDFKLDLSLVQLPRTVPTATLAQAAKILQDNRVVPTAGLLTRTVASIVQEILQFEACNAAFFDRFEVQDHIAKKVTQLLDEVFAQDRSDGKLCCGLFGTQARCNARCSATVANSISVHIYYCATVSTVSPYRRCTFRDCDSLSVWRVTKLSTALTVRFFPLCGLQISQLSWRGHSVGAAKSGVAAN